MKKKMLVDNCMSWAVDGQKEAAEELVQSMLNDLSTQVSRLRDGCVGPEKFRVKVDANPSSPATDKEWIAPKGVKVEPRWTEIRFVVEEGKVEIRVLRGLYGERRFLYIVSDLCSSALDDTADEHPFNWSAVLKGRVEPLVPSTGTYGIFEYVGGEWTSEHRWNINWAHALLWPIR